MHRIRFLLLLTWSHLRSCFGAQWSKAEFVAVDAEANILPLPGQRKRLQLDSRSQPLDVHRPAQRGYEHFSLALAADKDPNANVTSQASPNRTHAEGDELLNTPEKEYAVTRRLFQVWLPVLIVLVTLFEGLHFRWSEVDWVQGGHARPEGARGEVDASFRGLTSKLVRRAVSLGRIYFAGPGRIKGSAYVMMLVCHNICGHYLDLVNFDYQSRFYNFYKAPTQAMFVALIWNWFVLHGSLCITGMYSQYTQRMLMIHWRDHMTRYFERIWVPHSYAFKTKDDQRLDNPDQRIQEDIGSYVSGSYELTLGLANAAINTVIYSVMLCRVQPKSAPPGTLLGVAMLYAFAGSVIVHFVGRDLAFLNWNGERVGGNFRAELRRVHDQSETVAALRSHDAELLRLRSRFEDIKINSWISMIVQKKLGCFHQMYDPFKAVIFACVLMPFFISGEVSLGTVKQCEMALSHITTSLSFFVSQYGRLASYRAGVDRLYNFRRSGLAFMKDKQEGNPPGTSDSMRRPDLQVDRELRERLAAIGPTPQETSTEGSPAIPGGMELNRLELSRATISLPSGAVLLEDLHFRVNAGSSVLLCGSEGSGKSTLLRTLAGIWPFVQYSEPQNTARSTKDIVLIPQKPRLPMPMTLRQAATFPNDPAPYSDEEILRVLEQVKLSELAAVGLDEMMDVNSALSGGQFQKLMVAHCLLVKPAFILLDESMAHLSRENQLHLYGLLSRELVERCGCGMVSTCHNIRDLAPFHQVHYMIKRHGAERQNSTGSLDSVQGLQTLELFDPFSSEVVETGNGMEESLQKRLAEQDEEITTLQQAIKVLQERSETST